MISQKPYLVFVHIIYRRPFHVCTKCLIKPVFLSRKIISLSHNSRTPCISHHFLWPCYYAIMTDILTAHWFILMRWKCAYFIDLLEFHDFHLMYAMLGNVRQLACWIIYPIHLAFNSTTVKPKGQHADIFSDPMLTINLAFCNSLLFILVLF